MIQVFVDYLKVYHHDWVQYNQGKLDAEAVYGKLLSCAVLDEEYFLGVALKNHTDYTTVAEMLNSDE